VETLQVVLAVVGTLALIVFGIWFAHHLEAKRREALLALAQSLGLTFQAGSDPDFDDVHPHAPFHIGRGRRAFNLLQGEATIEGERYPVTMGDYHYTEQQGKNRVTRRFSFALFRLPFPGVPDLAIRHEHLGHKLLGALGFEDIDFESEAFSRRFHVKSSDKRFAYAVVDPRMMAFLLDGTPPEILLQRGECVFTVSVRRRWDPAEFRTWYDWGCEFFRRWPEHLRRELAERRPSGWSA
jgi:hypothetical protein